MASETTRRTERCLEGTREGGRSGLECSELKCDRESRRYWLSVRAHRGTEARFTQALAKSPVIATIAGAREVETHDVPVLIHREGDSDRSPAHSARTRLGREWKKIGRG